MAGGEEPGEGEEGGGGPGYEGLGDSGRAGAEAEPDSEEAEGDAGKQAEEVGHVIGLLIADAEIGEEAEAGADGEEEFACADGSQ